MAQPTTNGHGNGNGNGNGAAGKILWAQTPQGRAQLSASVRRSRAENPHSTKALSPKKIAKAKELVADGKQYVEVAKQLKMSVSSVKRHAAGDVPARASDEKPKSGKPKSGLGRRIPEPTKRRIRKLLAAGVPPMEIAERTKVHNSTVYNERARMKAERDGEVDSQAETDAPALSVMLMAGLLHAKKYTYTEVWDQRRELTGSELRFLIPLDQHQIK